MKPLKHTQLVYEYHKGNGEIIKSILSLAPYRLVHGVNYPLLSFTPIDHRDIALMHLDGTLYRFIFDSRGVESFYYHRLSEEAGETIEDYLNELPYREFFKCAEEVDPSQVEIMEIGV